MKLSIAEQTLLKRKILLPKVIRYMKKTSDVSGDLNKFIEYTDQYNEYLDENNLKAAFEVLPYALQHLVRHVEQDAVDQLEREVSYKLNNAKKDYVINALKSFNDFKKDTDKELSKKKNKTDDDSSDIAKIKSLMKSV